MKCKRDWYTVGSRRVKIAWVVNGSVKLNIWSGNEWTSSERIEENVFS